MVANFGNHLDILVYDKSEYVRITVANKGYGLDILVNDKSRYVRKAAKQKLAELEK